MLLTIHTRRVEELGRHTAPMTVRVWGEHRAQRVATSVRDPEVEANVYMISATGPTVDAIEIPDGATLERISDQVVRVNGVLLHASWTTSMLAAELATGAVRAAPDAGARR